MDDQNDDLKISKTNSKCIALGMYTISTILRTLKKPALFQQVALTSLLYLLLDGWMQWVTTLWANSGIYHLIHDQDIITLTNEHILIINLFLFSGQMKLPSNSYKQRLGLYGLYSFGVPALMTLTVVILNQDDISNSNLFDPEVDNSGYIVNENWRPGIGEESCWLSSCSYGQLIYFYL